MLTLPNRVREAAISWGYHSLYSFPTAFFLGAFDESLRWPIRGTLAIATGIFAAKQAELSNKSFTAMCLFGLGSFVAYHALNKISDAALTILLIGSWVAAMAVECLTKDKDSVPVPTPPQFPTLNEPAPAPPTNLSRSSSASENPAISAVGGLVARTPSISGSV